MFVFFVCFEISTNDNSVSEETEKKTLCFFSLDSLTVFFCFQVVIFVIKFGRKRKRIIYGNDCGVGMKKILNLKVL